MVLFLGALVITSAQAGSTTYRQIEDGLGNCIWATHALPKDGEATYTDVRQKFQSPDKVMEHRCYYPDRLDVLLKEGRLENSMRSPGKYWSNYILTGPGGQLDQIVNISQPWNYSGDVASFDQTRAILDPNNSNCVMKSSDPKTASPAGCVDIEKALRSAAKGKFPYTGNLCLDIYFTKADVTAEQIDPGTNTKVVGPVVETRRISAGCMAYTVTK